LPCRAQPGKLVRCSRRLSGGESGAVNLNAGRARSFFGARGDIFLNARSGCDR
jgi:hypothetical protein